MFFTYANESIRNKELLKMKEDQLEADRIKRLELVALNKKDKLLKYKKNKVLKYKKKKLQESNAYKKQIIEEKNAQEEAFKKKVEDELKIKKNCENIIAKKNKKRQSRQHKECQE